MNDALANRDDAGPQLLAAVRALLLESTAARTRSSRAISGADTSKSEPKTVLSVTDAATALINQIFAHFSPSSSIQLLKILHALENDLVEPFLQQTASNESALALLAMLALLARELLSRLPKNPLAIVTGRHVALCEPWENCIKSILLIINNIIGHDFVDAVGAFENTSATLFGTLQSNFIFYRNKLVAAACLLEIISASTEVKKSTRRDHLGTLLTTLHGAPSVELQLLCVEAIYRVLPSSRCERTLILRDARAKDSVVAGFVAMESKSFDTSSRDLVNNINNARVANIKSTKVTYPCSISAVGITCAEDAVYFEAAAADQDLLLIFVDIHPDALSFSCKFQSTGCNETAFDILYRCIQSVIISEQKMTAELRVSDVARVMHPECIGTTVFTFDLADTDSITLLQKVLISECCGRVQCVLRSKVSCLASPISAVLNLEPTQQSCIFRTNSYIQPRVMAIQKTSETLAARREKNQNENTSCGDDIAVTNYCCKPDSKTSGEAENGEKKQESVIFVVSESPTPTTSPPPSESTRPEQPTFGEPVKTSTATSAHTNSENQTKNMSTIKRGRGSPAQASSIGSSIKKMSIGAKSARVHQKAGNRKENENFPSGIPSRSSPSPCAKRQEGKNKSGIRSNNDKENINMASASVFSGSKVDSNEARQRKLLLASPKSAAMLEEGALPSSAIKTPASKKAKQQATKGPMQLAATKTGGKKNHLKDDLASNSRPKNIPKKIHEQKNCKRAREDVCSEVSAVSSRPKRACGEQAVIRMAAIQRATRAQSSNSEKSIGSNSSDNGGQDAKAVDSRYCKIARQPQLTDSSPSLRKYVEPVLKQLTSPSKKHATPCPDEDHDQIIKSVLPGRIGQISPQKVSPRSSMIIALQKRVEQLERDQTEKPIVAQIFQNERGLTESVHAAAAASELKTGSPPRFMVPRTPASRQNQRIDISKSSVGHLFSLEIPCYGRKKALSEAPTKRTITPMNKNAGIEQRGQLQSFSSKSITHSLSVEKPNACPQNQYMTPKSIAKHPRQPRRAPRDLVVEKEMPAQTMSPPSPTANRHFEPEFAKNMVKCVTGCMAEDKPAAPAATMNGQKSILRACYEFGEALSARFEEIERRLQQIVANATASGQELKEYQPAPLKVTANTDPKPAARFEIFASTTRNLIAAHDASLRALEDMKLQLFGVDS